MYNGNSVPPSSFWINKLKILFQECNKHTSSKRKLPITDRAEFLWVAAGIGECKL